MARRRAKGKTEKPPSAATVCGARKMRPRSRSTRVVVGCLPAMRSRTPAMRQALRALRASARKKMFPPRRRPAARRTIQRKSVAPSAWGPPG